MCGYLLAAHLGEAGDLAAAEQACAVTLAQARDAGDLYALDWVLPVMADLDLRSGRTVDAAAHLREAAQLALRTGAWFAALNALNGCGHLCAATGRYAEAVTAWAAYAALYSGPDAPVDVRRREELLRAARQALGPERAWAAEERGAAMSLETATEYTLLLADDPAPRQPGTPQAAAGLSPRERELVTLVAQGRTDADIAAQLYISIRTVRSHLDRIRDKTGARRRADLTRLALTAGLV
jgi:DNA-binding CsgD family transcriptional regulator